MARYGVLTVTRCPVCQKKQALSGSQRPGTLVVCAGCHSHLQVTAQSPSRLLAVDARLTRTADSQPESYA
jgi:hypothetical protein